MRILSFLAALLLLSACGSGQEPLMEMEQAASTDGAASGGSAPSVAAERAASAPKGAAADAAAPVAPPVEAQAPAGGRADTAIVPSMIIRTGQASVEVDSLEPAIARVRRIAAGVGGYVANTSMSTGENEVRRASLELKVPAARFDQAVGGLSPLGRVESVNVTAEDVGEEFVDVSARVANARRLEERLVTLLATRTGKLEDVLAVERELARVREEIERFEGRLRYLRTRVAVSTLTVNLHEPVSVIGGDHPGTNPIVEAFRDAWRNFVGFLAGLIASLGWLVPLGLILWAAWRLFRRVRGPRWPSRRDPAPPTPGDQP